MAITFILCIPLTYFSLLSLFCDAAPTGVEYIIDFIADDRGFRPTGKHLPGFGNGQPSGFQPSNPPAPKPEKLIVPNPPGSNVLSDDLLRPQIHHSAPKDTMFPNLYTGTSKGNQFGLSSADRGYPTDSRTKERINPVAKTQPTFAPTTPQRTFPTRPQTVPTRPQTVQTRPQTVPTRPQTVPTRGPVSTFPTFAPTFQTQPTTRFVPTQPPSPPPTQAEPLPEFSPMAPQGFQPRVPEESPNREVIDEVKIDTPPRSRDLTDDDDDDDGDDDDLPPPAALPPSAVLSLVG